MKIKFNFYFQYLVCKFIKKTTMKSILIALLFFISVNSFCQELKEKYITAYVYNEHKNIKDNQIISFRIKEAIEVNGISIPSNTIFYSAADINDKRVNFRTEKIEIGNKIYQLKLTACDSDLKEGLAYVGKSPKMNLWDGYWIKFLVVE